MTTKPSDKEQIEMKSKLHRTANEAKSGMKPRARSVVGIGVLCCIGTLLGGCERESISPAVVEIHGAGSTFPMPLFNRWFSYMMELHPDLEINYEKIGSGAGVRQFVEELVDFAASDYPLSDQEIAQVDRGVRQMPMTSGAIALAYNLCDEEGNPVTNLRLSREAYIGIFLGKIQSWSDEEIARHNPDVAFPELPIQVEYRLDASGTTTALTRHLSKISEEWKNGPGVGMTVDWPVGSGMLRNKGVARGLKQVPGSIGYVSYAFAKQNDLPMAILENRAGSFVAPSLDSIKLGLSRSRGSMDDAKNLASDPDGVGVYPIVTYSWILCYRVYQDPRKLAMIKELVSYGLQEGQQYSQQLGFVALLDGVSQDALESLESITLPRSADAATSIPVADSDSPLEPGAEVDKEVVHEDQVVVPTIQGVPPEKAVDLQSEHVSVTEAAADDKDSNAAGLEPQKTDDAADNADQTQRE